MSLKKFKFAKVAIAIILAMIMAQAVILNNYILASVAVFTAIFAMIFLRKQIKEVVADERDYKIAGDAARWTLSIFSVLGWFVSLVFIMVRHQDPRFELAGAILAYAICALLIIHSLISAYLRGDFSRVLKARAAAVFIVGLLLALLFVIFGLRMFSEEDGWICDNGQWIKHGNPSASAPLTPCD